MNLDTLLKSRPRQGGSPYGISTKKSPGGALVGAEGCLHKIEKLVSAASGHLKREGPCEQGERKKASLKVSSVKEDSGRSLPYSKTVKESQKGQIRVGGASEEGRVSR